MLSNKDWCQHNDKAAWIGVIESRRSFIVLPNDCLEGGGCEDNLANRNKTTNRKAISAHLTALRGLVGISDNHVRIPYAYGGLLGHHPFFGNHE